MAKQTINIGTTANDGTGTPLRDSFDIVNDNFTEVYAKPDLTLSTNTLTLTKADGSTDTVNLAPYLDGDITSIIAGNGLTGGATAGDATLNVVGGDGITVAADEVEATVDDSTIELSATNGSGALRVKDLGIVTAKLANDGVTFAKLENRYTALSALGSGTSFALNFSAATTFTATASGAATLTFSNAVQGQVIDLVITGNYALTFAETGSTFNKVGSTTYDGSSTNLIQIICTDDSSGAKIYHYSIATYTASQPQ
jgi:hypothetical protein